jgi:Uri superfamily endonuclease
MPTAQSYLVAPSGGDYTNLTDALAALPTNLVTADEVWTINIETFSGGLNENVNMPSLTTDATRFLTIQAAPGHEYDPVADTGAFIYTTSTYNEALNLGSTDYIKINNLGFKATGHTSSIPISAVSADYVEIDGCYLSTTTSNKPCFEGPTVEFLTVRNTLAVGGTYGFYINNYASASYINCTSINPSTSGFRHGPTSASVTTDNCLHIDGVGGGSTFSAGASVTGDHNATSDSTSPTGANSLANRSTSDLTDYAGGDYRTASGSALATAGNGTDAAYIGYALEAGGGPTYSLTLDAGSYVYTGSAVDLIVGRKIGITAGSYAYTGSAVDLIAGRKLVITPGSYTYTGSSIDLKVGRKLTIDPASYTYTGNDVTLTYTPAGGATYTLTLDAGSYALTGSSVDLLANRKLALDAGSYAYTGSAAPLIVGRKLAIESGSYAVNGQSVNLIVGRKLSIDAGAYNYTGFPVTLSYSGVVISLISGYSVQYSQDNISINFNSDNIQAEFT